MFGALRVGSTVTELVPYSAAFVGGTETVVVDVEVTGIVCAPVPPVAVFAVGFPASGLAATLVEVAPPLVATVAGRMLSAPPTASGSFAFSSEAAQAGMRARIAMSEPKRWEWVILNAVEVRVEAVSRAVSAKVPTDFVGFR